MKKISFIKMSGAGNDFIVINKDLFPELIFNNDSIRKLCDRRNGIGADGLITVSDGTGKYNFVMNYYNSDGSTGSLCGNGARCALRFAEYSEFANEKIIKFLSNGVEYSGEIIATDVTKVNFNAPSDINLNFIIRTAGQSIKCSFINTGSPHVIININDVLKDPANSSSFFNDINVFPVVELGREIRYLDAFSPNGANVNFIQMFDGGIKIRTYERGVEDETLSCGTGSVASALAAHFNAGIKPPVSLLTRGGDKLTVNFSSEGQIVKGLSLSGPARIIFAGKFLYNEFF
jgi:diaminopimelate epimerase